MCVSEPPAQTPCTPAKPDAAISRHAHSAYRDGGHASTEKSPALCWRYAADTDQGHGTDISATPQATSYINALFTTYTPQATTMTKQIKDVPIFEAERVLECGNTLGEGKSDLSSSCKMVEEEKVEALRCRDLGADSRHHLGQRPGRVGRH